MLTPTRNGLLIVFVEKYSKETMGFDQKTDWGFEIKGDHSTTGPRWAKVVAKGPEVEEDITLGMFVLIEELMWTTGFKHEGVDIWKTDSSKVMLVADENPL